MHNRMKLNYVNVSIKTINLHMSCGIITIVMGIILSIMAYFSSTPKSMIGRKLITIGHSLVSMFSK